MKQRYVDLMAGGLGGFGVLLLGRLLVEAGMLQYRNVFFLPIYGAMVRWGDCECTVILSDDKLASSVVRNPQLGIAMSSSYFKELDRRIKPGGQLFVNSSMVSDKSTRNDLKVWYVPALEMAASLGQTQVANLVLLGAFLQATNAVSLDSIDQAIEVRLAGKKRAGELLDMNRKALREGAKWVQANQVS